MRVLVVENNPLLSRSLLQALADEGHRVDTFASGRDALSQVGVISYDLIIVEWLLPDIDGVGVLRALRAQGARMPIVMLTERGVVNERISALDHGADDCLPKPFDINELLARVRALRRRAQSATALQVGPLAFNPVTRRVSVEGRMLELTMREFMLLRHLLSAVGRVVSRSELVNKVWETNYDPSSNVVDVYVKKIREKLGQHAGMIETVRGVGYRVVVPDVAPAYALNQAALLDS